MPLTDHLRELRNCVVTMALALAAGMAVGSVLILPALRVIERPLCWPRSAGIRAARRLRSAGWSWMARSTCSPRG